MKWFIRQMNLLRRWFGGNLQSVLIAAFVLIAILTGVLNTLVISRVINNYLANSQSTRVARDIEISTGLYQQKMSEVVALGERTASDQAVLDNLSAAIQGDQAALTKIDQVVLQKLTVPKLTGVYLILVVDPAGEIVAGRVSLANGQISPAWTSGNWGELTIVRDCADRNEPLQGTEIISAALLAQVNLDQQALVPLKDTPQDAPLPYDPREGTAGLALMGTEPLHAKSGSLAGVVVAAHLFNNEFSFVDYMKEVAQIETTTLFLGDMRVSTNVVDHTGARAVGTRVSQSVYDQVLLKGQPFAGRVFVVEDWYTGRYEPLRDHRQTVVGILYVGVRESVFKSLANDFNRTAALIALISIIVAGVFAIPIARLITQPIGDLVQANRRLAMGDMNVRVQPVGRGEIAQLGTSFNTMVETLQRTQHELVQKEELASLGQLAAGVAHELNNPLGTILLFSGALYDETPAGHSQREDLKMIISETHRCKAIVSDLLNFARQQQLLAQDTDLHALIHDVCGRMREQPKFDHISLVYNLDLELPHIQADPAQLQQVLINLINNAADAMPAGGQITISTRILDMDLIELKVADIGTGIAEEHLDKLFTPFYTTKPAGHGTGLGLAIVYGIIKLHQGQIRIESRVGAGTAVIINLHVNLPGHVPGHTADGSELIA